MHTKDPELMPLRSFLTFRLARVHARLNTQAGNLLKQTSGISLSQWRVLAMIGSGGEDTVSAADIKRLVGFDKGLFSRTLQGLIREGLVTSVIDAQDHRRQRLSLTEAGRTVYDRTLPAMRARQEKLRAALEPEELAALFSALDKLEAVVAGEDEA